jgi:hypothetical protein
MATTEYARDSDGAATFLLQAPAFQGLARQAGRVGICRWPIIASTQAPTAALHRRMCWPNAERPTPPTDRLETTDPPAPGSQGAGAADPLVACSHRGARRRRSREGASGGSWSKLSLEKREKGTHRGGSPSHSQPRRWIARAGRFNDRRSIRPSPERLRRRRGRQPGSCATRLCRRCGHGPRPRTRRPHDRRPCVSPTG